MDNANDEVMSIRQKPRILDFVTLDGLQLHTGCIPEMFVDFIVKELIDNALDKRNVHNIEVGIIRRDGHILLYVADDGEQKFTYESLTKILDFKNAPSSKRGIKRIQRGVLGNALQCCFGISYALWKDEDRPEYTALVKGEECWFIALKVENHDIKPIITPLSNNESVKNCTAQTSLHVQNFTGSTSIDLESLPPTVVMFKLPLFDFINPIETVKYIASVNPHVTIKYREDEWCKSFEALTTAASPIFPSNFGDIWWYSFDDFQQLAQEFSMTDVTKFVSQFKKFSSVIDAKKLLSSVNVEPATFVGSLGKDDLKRLFHKMREKAKPSSPRTLPIVGEAVFQSRGAEKYVLKRGILKDKEKHIPFIFEAAAFPSLPRESKITECVNFTVSLYRPFSKWAWTQDDGKKVFLYDLIQKGNKHLNVLIHFVCPNITWLNPSKGEIANVSRFQEHLFSVVKSVVKIDSGNLDEARILEWVKQIFEKMPNFKFTLRQIFYQLVAKYGYPNTRNSYTRLSKILRKAREHGLIDPEKIVDLTRPEYSINLHRTLEEYKSEKIRGMIENFDLDRWGKQPRYVEVWIEKEALSRVILPVCQKYRVNLIVGRGYSSYTQIYRAAQRFPTEKPAIILYCGDLDPPGLHIEEKLTERLKKELLLSSELKISRERLDELWEENDLIHSFVDLEVKRVALTHHQVEEYSLPPSPLKKAGQKYREYMKLYGDSVWELDALDPQILTALLEEKIKELIDWNIWNEREKEVEEKRKQLEKELASMLPTYLQDNCSGSGG